MNFLFLPFGGKGEGKRHRWLPFGAISFLLSHVFIFPIYLFWENELNLKYFLSAILGFYTLTSFGQSVMDSLLVLPVVEVNARQKEVDNSENTRTLTKEKLLTYQGHSAADILQSEGLGFVKSYGAGSIALASIRGGAAGQVAIFWNGLPIQSPMLGLVDLSILQLGGVDELQLTKGGQSSHLGSGAVSGTLQLTQGMPEKGIHTQLTSSIGSFAQQKQSFTFTAGSEKWRIRSTVHKNSAENNFPYQVREDLPIIYTPHARTDQSGFEQAVYWQLHPQHRLQFQYWQQESTRLIPPTSVQTRSETRQEDGFKRSLIRYTGQSKKAVLEGQLAYFKEDILFEDPQILLSSFTSFDSYIAQFSMARTLGQHWYSKGGIQIIHNSAEADAYGALKTQSHFAIHQQFSRSLSEKIKIEVGGRLTALKEVNEPIAAFHLKLNGRIQKNIQYHARISRDFRIPTLNDLYWIPGGKLDLETEYALGQEIGLAYRKQNGATDFWSYQLNVFNRNVDNWIQWTQLESSGIWAVDNITKVWSRGVEQSINGQFKLGKATILPQFRIDWIKSTYQTSIKNPSIEKGQTLWYTPEWQAFAQLKIALLKWSITYSHQWTSETAGINKDLAAYHLGRAEIHYKYRTKHTHLNLFGRLANIWDTTYRVIENRPMAGRHFEIGLSIRGHIKN